MCVRFWEPDESRCYEVRYRPFSQLFVQLALFLAVREPGLDIWVMMFLSVFCLLAGGSFD